MWTLALETTSPHGSLALLADERVQTAVPLEAREYAVSLFQAVEAVLGDAGLKIRDIGLFAVADGPGSFTGVRIGLTAVKGWIEVLGQPAAPVSTLRAAAVAAGVPAGTAVMVALDASRGEVYYGVYGQGAEGDLEGIEPLTAFAARRAAATGWRAVTPDASVAAHIPDMEIAPALLAPAVGQLGLAAWRRGASVDALRLDARYIRRPDATLPTAARR